MTFLLVLLAGLSVLEPVLPGEIDPLDPASGDFLDMDLESYLQYAMDSYTSGSYQMAASYFLSYLSRNISDETAIYNLACCYGLLGEGELASLYLIRAVNAGFSDITLIREDRDFQGVRDHPEFSEAVDMISSALGEPPQFSGEEILFQAASAHRCLMRYPEDFDESDGEYDLVIGLHGFGDTPENYVRLWGYFNGPDFIFACPQAPYLIREGGVPGYSWFRAGGDSRETASLDLVSSEYVASLSRQLRERYPVRRVFLLGFSQGCGLTWLAGLDNPQDYSGLIGMGGILDPAFIPDSIIGDTDTLRAFVASGTQDQSAGVDQGEQAVAYLEGLGIPVVFRTWEGGHSINRAVLLEAQEWISAGE